MTRRKVEKKIYIYINSIKNTEILKIKNKRK